MAFKRNEIIPILEKVRRGRINLENLPPEVFNFIQGQLKDSLAQGFGEAIGDQVAGSSRDQFVKKAAQNVKSFSAHKTFRMVRDLQSVAKGKSFEEFAGIGEKVFRKYTQTWQEVENRASHRKARSGDHWTRIQDNKDLYPKLTYQTQGDDRVRDEHERMEGITKPVDDPFWDRYMPPNGWNCRCPKPRQQRGSVPDSDVDLRTVPKPDRMFNNNPGKTGDIFPEDHPYFEAPKKEGMEEASEKDFGF